MKGRKYVVLVGGLFAGVAVYYGLMALLVFFVSDVLQISISTADRQSLVILVILKLVPLVGAMLTVVLIIHALRRKEK